MFLRGGPVLRPRLESKIEIDMHDVFAWMIFRWMVNGMERIM